MHCFEHMYNVKSRHPNYLKEFDEHESTLHSSLPYRYQSPNMGGKAHEIGPCLTQLWLTPTLKGLNVLPSCQDTLDAGNTVRKRTETTTLGQRSSPISKSGNKDEG
jgi:hypothetical protein